MRCRTPPIVPLFVPVDDDGIWDDGGIGRMRQKGADMAQEMTAATWRIEDDGTLIVGVADGCEKGVIVFGTETDEDGREWNAAPWDERADEITAVRIEEGVCIQGDMSNIFAGCFDLKSADVANLDTSAATRMDCAFYGCDFEAIDVSSWDVSNVVSMDSMFESCESLKAIDLSGWNTASVRNVSWLFSYCFALEEADVSGWDTANVTAADGMFNHCSSLTKVNAAGWDTSNVTNAEVAFLKCGKLEEVVGIGGWVEAKE